MIFTSAALSDVGLVRSNNEDSYLADQAQGIFVVADGMGGCLAGEVASSLAIKLFREDLTSELDDNEKAGFLSHNAARLTRAVAYANQGVNNASYTKAELAGMGTTLVAIFLDGYRLTIAHVGDSRVYLVRGSSIVRLTEDHSYVEERLPTGILNTEQCLLDSQRHILTKAIGPLPQMEPDISETDLMDGDKLLLCSDGLTTTVSDEMILELMNSGSDPAEICEKLVSAANDRGGEDNITVVTVFLTDNGYIKRFMRWMRG